MPYLGRAPVGVAGNVIDGDLKVTGTISGESINHKLALNGSDASSPQANENDQFLFEDGGTDGSGTNAGDNLLLEDVTPSQAEVSLASISAAGTSGQVLQSQGSLIAPAFATVAGGAIEKLFIADNSGNQVVGTGSWTTVTFDTETLDQGGHFASNKFTAPSDGKYMFFCTHMYLESSGTVDQRMSLNHYNSSDSLQLQRSVFKTTVHEASMSGVGAFSMSASDYVLMQVYHAKGSNANLHKAQMFGWRVV